ncbi:MAG: hypothetical protein NC038_00085 [Paludibacter sp.]|nr:hypothetical protein [Bacteroidales bacterium]MCM1068763.1 hypothetical protein [Prevotella sp.]MCM1354475.1 hypothetical protein [Bacteroides sp.]MCM1443278.1 hypothetical protein [Muribaculum sp.]MCM1481037.1 hypothetical protein [Paludibacter sp.]
MFSLNINVLLAQQDADVMVVNRADWEALLQRIERLEVDATSGATPKEEPLPEDTVKKDKPKDTKNKKERKTRFWIGGYGEATMMRAFYSDNYLRYSKPENYKNDSYGQFDLPHVVLAFGCDFGKGWSMGTEIEFEHGGMEGAVEIEEEEAGEYETEIERGGEVAIEQFWIQKSFNEYANLRAGMIIVPVGPTNAHHEPNRFFGVFRPEGDNAILPCTWHEVGLSFFGRYKFWRYEIQFLPGLDSDRFGRTNWVKYGAGSPYEFKLATCYAAAMRYDFYAAPGLRLSLSGYCGTSFDNTLSNTSADKYKDVHGLVSIGSADFKYDAHNLILRGGFTYGHLNDARTITEYNMQMRKDSPSKRQLVASDAYSFGVEAGYDFFALNNKLVEKKQKFYVFARYDLYDSQFKVDGDRNAGYAWCGRQRFAAGFNYYPLPEIIVKGEFSYGILNKVSDGAGTFSKKYNDEPAISLGIAYCGIFFDTNK